MADPRTSFMVLEDAVTQAGLMLHKVLEGDALAAKNALAALVAKDGTNLAYLKLNPTSKALYVDSEVPGTKKRALGELAAGSSTIVLVTGANIVLTASKVYTAPQILVSCRRDALFQLIWNDNGAETIHAEVVVGSGQYTFSELFSGIEFTAGATGTQELKIKAKNFEALASLRAMLTVKEIT